MEILSWGSFSSLVSGVEAALEHFQLNSSPHMFPLHFGYGERNILKPRKQYAGGFGFDNKKKSFSNGKPSNYNPKTYESGNSEFL